MTDGKNSAMSLSALCLCFLISVQLFLFVFSVFCALRETGNGMIRGWMTCSEGPQDEIESCFAAVRTQPLYVGYTLLHKKLFS